MSKRGAHIVRVTTESGTQILIDMRNKLLHRIPREGSITAYSDGWHRFLTITEPAVGRKLYVRFDDETQWTEASWYLSTTIASVEDEILEAG